MAGYFDKKIDALISAYKDASARTRSVFMIINLATALSLVALLNSVYYLTPSLIEEKQKILERGKISSEVLKKNSDLLNETIESMYKEQASANIPILGIRFNVFDLGSFNAIAVVILTTWLFFCSRRENKIIEEVYKDIIIHKGSADFKEMADYVYQGIVNQSVFTTVTKRDFSETAKKGNHKINRLARLLTYVLILAPAIVTFLILTRDTILFFNLLKPDESGFPTFFLCRNVLIPLLALLYCSRQLSGILVNDKSKRGKLSEINGLVMAKPE